MLGAGHLPGLRTERGATEGQVVPIELTADTPGEYGFECGMGMLHGKLIVR